VPAGSLVSRGPAPTLSVQSGGASYPFRRGGCRELWSSHFGWDRCKFNVSIFSHAAAALISLYSL
jgi:hypothetical protein